LLVVLLAINWIWTGDAIQVGSFAFAAAAIFAVALALIVSARRDALRRGPPQPTRDPETVPAASLGAVLVAVAVASIVFGLAFGHFLVYFGAGLLVVSLGMVLREWLAERRQRRAWLERERR
jgi:ribose/xylose/arabinose/galactoside ABC-type transport system permease subunit